MWKVLYILSSSCLMAQLAAAAGGAESLSFHGYLPSEMILSSAPVADNHPNDVYQHLPVNNPVLQEDEVVIYPHHFGFEYGQDPEQKIYEVHNAKELAAQHAHSKHGKHGKHGKHAHNHGHHDHHHDDANASPKSLAHHPAAPVKAPAQRKPSFPPKHATPSHPSPPRFNNYPAKNPNSIPRGYPSPAPPPYPYQQKQQRKAVFPPRF